MSEETTQVPQSTANDQQPDADFIRAIEQILEGYQSQMSDRINTIEANLRKEFSMSSNSIEPEPSVAKTALEKQIEDLKNQLNESAIKTAMGDLADQYNVPSKYRSMFVTMLRSKGAITNDNGDLYITDSKGQPHTLSDFAESFIKSDEGKVLVGKQSAPNIPYGSQNQNKSNEPLDPFMALAGLV